ncbi:hypothetical protein KSP40_PGU010307 [Platanthera guangdongensis]|uniref:Enhancer of polycomb-like protein n=1 Tax=Platanthera guangdongensis TaxID=2320717 RepID=A0ABR2LJM5_9ASPA
MADKTTNTHETARVDAEGSSRRRRKKAGQNDSVAVAIEKLADSVQGAMQREIETLDRRIPGQEKLPPKISASRGASVKISIRIEEPFPQGIIVWIYYTVAPFLVLSMGGSYRDLKLGILFDLPMERSVEKADASDNRRKSKPLDSLSISVRESATPRARFRAKGGISIESSKSKVLKRKRNSFIENGAPSVEFRRKRSGKEVSLNSFINGSGKTTVRLGVSGLKANGSFSGVGKREKSSSSSGAPRPLKSARHNSHTVGNDFTLTLPSEENQFSCAGDLRSSNGLEVGIVISKRPRGVLRRKKRIQSFNYENEMVGASRTKSNVDQLKNKLSSQPHINKQKRKLTEFKEDGSTDNISLSGTRNGGNVDSVKATKRRSQGRKRTSLANYDSIRSSAGAFRDDDEDNLEQNAARMLSSRFDPSCAGFSHCMVGSSKPSKDSSFVSSQRNSNGFDAELNDKGRVLRPRNYGGRGFVRKRRHFYEVCSNNVDPYWVVKQRIRVFWPLDKCWYFGLVKGYDPITKMHHVKYDDRDEEWINLQNERFKLLLFPSELSNKFNHERSKNEVKKKNKKEKKESMNDLSTGCLVETEPIISWLARSSRRERPSTLGIIKTQRRILSASKGLPSTMSKLSSMDGSVEYKSTENKVFLENRKLPFVYSRRRIRKDRGYLGNIIKSNSDHTGSSGPISLLVSVADIGWAMEEFYITVIPKVLTHVIVRLRLPIWDRCKIMHGSDNFLLCRSPFLFNYKLIQLLPLVRMEVGFMDNLGLKQFLFEGCLNQAADFLCQTFRGNYCQKNSHRLSTENMQLKKIRINMSNLNNNSQRLHFVVDSFLVGNSRWRYFENWLKQHCIRLKELCPEDHVKSLSIRCGRALVQPFKEIAPLEDRLKNKDKSNYFPVEESDQVSDITLDNFGSSSTVATDSKLSSSAHLRVETDALCLSDEECLKSTHDCLSIEVNDVSRSVGYSDPAKCIKANGGAHSVKYNNLGKNSSDEAFPKDTRSYISEHLRSSFPDVTSSPDKSEGGCFSSSKTATIKALRRTRAEEGAIYTGTGDAHSETSLLWEMNEHAIHSPNATAPRSVWQHNRHSLVSPIAGSRSSLWSEDFIQSGFLSTTKKPRTHVSYPALSRGPDIKLKNRIHHRKGSLHKRLKTDLPRKASVGSETHRSFQESLTCQANVLITAGDRGWRELGAEVVLDSDDQKDWKIVVRVSGITKFTYKAYHVLQPGIPNRYTHAMMWKGGKDWSLEFSDRNQWLLFKMMHGQCFNQNIRAASVKNIPIPGVRLIDDPDESFPGVPFVRTSLKYYQLDGTEVDIALDPSHVLYDMDSDDDKWVSNFKDSLDSNGSPMCEVSDDMFERVMDMFERVAYVNQCDFLSDEEISEYMADFGSFDIIKAIHEFWHEKRRKNGMPLIRQYQSYSFNELARYGNCDSTMMHKMSNIAPQHQFRRRSPTNRARIGAGATTQAPTLANRRAPADFPTADSLLPMPEAVAVFSGLSFLLHRYKLFEINPSFDSFPALDEVLPLVVEVQPSRFRVQRGNHWRKGECQSGKAKLESSWRAAETRIKQLLSEGVDVASRHRTRPRSQRVGWARRSQQLWLIVMFSYVQPPLWERYHQQLKEWEQSMLKLHCQVNECHEKTIASENPLEKPPMFAFCLKPRGLEANKGRRLIVSSVGDEKPLVATPSYEGSHSTQWIPPSSNFSPRFFRNFSKKNGMHHSPWDHSATPLSSGERLKRNGVYRWNSDACEWPSSKQFQPDGVLRQQPDISEFRLRDASSAAQHASNMAKLKREKAQWLMHKADLALHKAVVAIMTADAIRTSQKKLIGDD